MTTTQIKAKADREMIKYNTATLIRQMLDKAKQQWDDDTEWDSSDIESEIIALVADDE